MDRFLHYLTYCYVVFVADRFEFLAEDVGNGTYEVTFIGMILRVRFDVGFYKFKQSLS